MSQLLVRFMSVFFWASVATLWEKNHFIHFSNRWRYVRRESVRELKPKSASVGLLSKVFTEWIFSRLCACDSSEMSVRQASECVLTAAYNHWPHNRVLGRCVQLYRPYALVVGALTHSHGWEKFQTQYGLVARFQCIPFCHSLYEPSGLMSAVSLTISSNSKTIRAKIFKKQSSSSTHRATSTNLHRARSLPKTDSSHSFISFCSSSYFYYNLSHVSFWGNLNNEKQTNIKCAVLVRPAHRKSFSVFVY